MNMEEIVFELIANGGAAKGMAYEAMALAEEGKFEEAEAALKEAEETLLLAHNTQTSLIHEEAAGNHHEVSVLFVHAQDHLMAGVEACTMAERMIALNKHIWELEAKIEQLANR